MELRVPGPDAEKLARLVTCGLADAQFSIPGQIVADISLERPAIRQADGSVSLHIEALTIAE